MLAGFALSALRLHHAMVGEPHVQAPHIFAHDSLEDFVSGSPCHAMLGDPAYLLKEVLSGVAPALPGVDLLHAKSTSCEGRCKGEGGRDKVQD